MDRGSTVAEALLARRTIHQFDPDRPIEPGSLVRILELATRAPSDFNLQPWRFLVVRDRKDRQKVGRCVLGPAAWAEAPVVVIVLGYLHPHQTHLEAIVDEMVRRGSLHHEAALAVKGRAASTMAREANPESWAGRSCMLAAAWLVLAAEGLGVQSALVERFESAPLRQAFGIPDDHAIGCLVGLGHALETPPFPGRLPLDAVCFSDHFGQPFMPNQI